MKKLLIYGALGYGAYWLWNNGRATYDDYKNALDQVKAGIKGVHDVKIKNGKVNLKANIQIINNSDKELGLNTGGNIILKTMRFYTSNGKFVAKALPDIAAIKIPAHGAVNFEGIPVSIPTKNIGGLLNNAVQILQDMNNLDVEMDLDVFGNTVTI